MSRRHFHLILPSNSSMNVYPKNTAAQYITKLPKAIELDGDWEISLKEIFIPHVFENIAKDECYVGFTTNDNGEIRKRYVSAGYYKSLETLLQKLNCMLDDIGVTFRLRNNNRRVAVTVPDRHYLEINPRLSEILGFGGVNNLYQGFGTFGGSEVPEMPSEREINAIYVYADVCEEVVVGDILAPLLRIVNVKKTKIRTNASHPISTALRSSSKKGLRHD